MILVHVVYKMPAENRAKFLTDIKEKNLQALTLEEPGCSLYRFSVPLDCEDEVILNEQWESQEAIAVHYESPNIKKLGAMKALYSIETSIKKYEV